jgi:hypothetical protein
MPQLLRYMPFAAFLAALASLGLGSGFMWPAQAETTDQSSATQGGSDATRVRPRARFPVILPAQDAAQPVRTSHARGSECRQNAIEKLRAAPDGFSVYQRIPDKNFFLGWLMCDDEQLNLPTAVHESVHFITADNDAYPLINGGEIKRPHEVSQFFAPALIAGKFKPSDLVSTYLRRGKASSATDFLYLLDELNAYTHDLNAAVDLSGLHSAEQQTDNRDGLAGLMAFVALYAQAAEESDPDTWSGLQKPQVAKTVSELWSRAERVMASSCGLPNFGTDDKIYIRQFCQTKPQSSMRKILGRAPICPTECLKDRISRLGELETEHAPRTR